MSTSIRQHTVRLLFAALSLPMALTAQTLTAPPTNVVAARNPNGGVLVSWTAPRGLVSFRVFRSPDLKSSWATLTRAALEPGTLSFADLGAAATTTYFYQVVAIYSDGTQGASLPVQYLPPATIVPVVQTAILPVLQPTGTLAVQPVALTPPVGPPPQGMAIDASGTYGVVAKVIWSATPNAVSYQVKHQLTEDPACCNASSPALPAGTTSWTDLGLLRKGHYMFTLLVNYADGSVGSAQMGIGANGVQNPVLTISDNGPGRVRLTWNNLIPGTTAFQLTGSGMGTGKTVYGTSYDIGALQPGSYTWTLSSIYTLGLGVLALGTPVTHTVSYGSGRYRISLEGFKAINPTVEDQFRNDGHGDEVFITTQVSEYDRSTMLSTRMARTPTFGDVQNFPTRIRAGSATTSGGIVANDQYPAATQYISQLQPATLSNLPYLLWEGDLTEIRGLVIISPAIWEADGDDRLFPYFLTFQIGAAPNLPFRSPFLGYVPGDPAGALDTWNPQTSCPTPLSASSPPTTFVPPINNWRDQPIDLSQDHGYCATYVAINYKVAHAMTTVNPAMVSEILFTNFTNNWQYKLFVRVEKVR